MKLVCKTCNLLIDAADKEVAEKLLEEHQTREHENKIEQLTTLVKSAQTMAFQLVNGTTPKRKDARKLLTLAAQVLGEPIPELPADENDQSPVTTAGQDSGGSSAAAGAGDGSKSKGKKADK